jgi:regulator of protease activity HflC (stomatin/prohibitin superfamily)
VTLDEQVIALKSGLTFQVAGVLYFKVDDVYKAIFEIEKLDESIRQLAMGVLRDEIAKHNDHHDLAETAKISAEIFSKIAERTDAWGVQLIDFRLTTVAPTSESAQVVNMEASALARKKVITEMAGNLNMSPEMLIQSGMAAILVGVPLVATTTVNSATTEIVKAQAE